MLAECNVLCGDALAGHQATVQDQVECRVGLLQHPGTLLLSVTKMTFKVTDKAGLLDVETLHMVGVLAASNAACSGEHTAKALQAGKAAWQHFNPQMLQSSSCELLPSYLSSLVAPCLIAV